MPTKKPKLTVKQAKFVKAKAEGKTSTEAAMIAYDVKTERTAAVIGAENLTKPNIQDALYAEFEKQGITLEKIVKPISDALEASKPEFEKNDEGRWENVGETPDHSIRLKASGMAAQFIGIGKNQEGGTTNYNFINVAKTDKDEFQL